MSDDASLSPLRTRYAYADYVLSKATGKDRENREKQDGSAAREKPQRCIHTYVCIRRRIYATYISKRQHRRKSGKDMQKSRDESSQCILIHVT